MIDLNERLFILYHSFSSAESSRKMSIAEGDGPGGRLFFWIKGLWIEGEGDLEETSHRKYEELFGVNPILQRGYFGPFHNIEELRRFAYLLCLELEGRIVHLFSQEQFNQIIKYCPDKNELLKELVEKSDSLDNLDRSKGKNLLDKIFNKP